MVLRRSSTPLHTLPCSTSPRITQDISPNLPSHLDVNSSDLPPVPMSSSKRLDQPDVHYEDSGNPWRRNNSPHDDGLNPALSLSGQPPVDPSQQKTGFPLSPWARKPEQNTPRSSLDSQRTRDFWDDDDDDEAKGGQNTQVWQDESNDAQRKKAEPTNDLGGRDHASDILGSASSWVKRKPFAINYSPEADTASAGEHPWPPELSSNNPFRRDASNEHPDHQHSALAWQDRFAEPSVGHSSNSFPGKGKEVPQQNDRLSPLVYSTERPNDNAAMAASCWNESPHSGAHHNHQSMETLLLDDVYSPPHPPHPAAPPPPVPQHLSPYTTQPPLIPVTPPNESVNPWQSEKIFVTGNYSDLMVPEQGSTPDSNKLYDASGQEAGVVSLRHEPVVLPHIAESESRTRRQQDGHGRNKDRFSPSLPSQAGQGTGSAKSNDLSEDEHKPPIGPPPTKASRPLPTGSLLENDGFQPPEGPPPIKPPRPAVVANTDADVRHAQLMEQRNETYQIKHFNWSDHRSNKLRRSSMLTQNQNGPCPLLALVNALILGAREDSQAALDNALGLREQVSLGLIIETLIDELITRNYEDLPDVDELNGFLSMLHTGMNANPKFTPSSSAAPNLMDARNSILHMPQSSAPKQKPGDFESTQDIKLYSAFSIPLVHGWLPSAKDPARQAFNRTAQTYEDAQAVQFGEEELEYKLSHGGLTKEEQKIWEDITSIKTFLGKYPTQLTPYGLDVIRQWLVPGQFAVMFRNDHFSTIYKHPQTGKLYTLITDAGYADRDEIIWESLSDHSGQGDFFSGDFRSVGGDAASPSGPGARTSISPRTARSRPQEVSQDANMLDSAGPPTPQERQAQHDADFAMALQLQEEEEQRANQNRRPSGNRGQSQGNIPIRLRSQPEIRPAIPPRTARTPNIAVNRPADQNAEDAPPAYEEAARGKPYVPPLGSPHHPGADPSPGSSTAQLAQTVSASSAPPRQEAASASHPRRLQQRRTSAYGENSLRYGGLGTSSPTVSRSMGQAHGVGAGGPPFARGRHNSTSRDGREERDCIVM